MFEFIRTKVLNRPITEYDSISTMKSHHPYHAVASALLIEDMKVTGSEWGEMFTVHYKTKDFIESLNGSLRTGDDIYTTG